MKRECEYVDVYSIDFFYSCRDDLCISTEIYMFEPKSKYELTPNNNPIISVTKRSIGRT